MSRPGDKGRKPGRPPGTVRPSADPKVPTALKLERSLREKARRIGEGHIAAGIRTALAEYHEQNPD